MLIQAGGETVHPRAKNPIDPARDYTDYFCEQYLPMLRSILDGTCACFNMEGEPLPADLWSCCFCESGPQQDWYQLLLQPGHGLRANQVQAPAKAARLAWIRRRLVETGVVKKQKTTAKKQGRFMVRSMGGGAGSKTIHAGMRRQYRIRSVGTLPCRKVGLQTRFDTEGEAIDAWLEAWREETAEHLLL